MSTEKPVVEPLFKRPPGRPRKGSPPRGNRWSGRFTPELTRVVDELAAKWSPLGKDGPLERTRVVEIAIRQAAKREGIDAKAPQWGGHATAVPPETATPAVPSSMDAVRRSPFVPAIDATVPPVRRSAK